MLVPVYIGVYNNDQWVLLDTVDTYAIEQNEEPETVDLVPFFHQNTIDPGLRTKWIPKKKTQVYVKFMLGDMPCEAKLANTKVKRSMFTGWGDVNFVWDDGKIVSISE